MGEYDHITNEMFHEELEKILGEQGASQLLAIPGLYEVVSEHFNNEILERIGPKENGHEDSQENH